MLHISLIYIDYLYILFCSNCWKYSAYCIVGVLLLLLFNYNYCFYFASVMCLIIMFSTYFILNINFVLIITIFLISFFSELYFLWSVKKRCLTQCVLCQFYCVCVCICDVCVFVVFWRLSTGPHVCWEHVTTVIPLELYPQPLQYFLFKKISNSSPPV